MYTKASTGFQGSAQAYSSLVIPYAYSNSFNSNKDINVNNGSECKHFQFKSPSFRSESDCNHFENQPVHQNASTTSKCRCFRCVTIYVIMTRLQRQLTLAMVMSRNGIIPFHCLRGSVT